jgi:hypothetical protein
MATSGTSTFNPSGGELLLFAYALCGLRRTALTAEHMADGRMAFNLFLSSLGNDIPNLWTVDLVSEVLVPGQATYTVPADTIMILDAYIRTGTGESQNDRIIWPISRTEYAAMPNKTLEAPPTVFWFDRQLAPTLSLWQTPDDQQVYTLQYYRATVVQDQNLAGGQNIEIPRWWMLAMAFGVAELVALIHAPDKAPALAAKAAETLRNAREQDTENVPMYIMPMLSGYFPR